MMRRVVVPQRSARNTSVVLVVAGVLLSVLGVHAARAQLPSGDHLWNFRQNADDRFHSNEAWLRPWRYNYEDGWGRWVGGYSYELKWGGTSTLGNSNGSFTISRDRDYQFHAWTFVYVTSPKAITFNGAGDCVPRVFLNSTFDLPAEFPATLNLVDGWNRIDITGYNQNSGYAFSCGALATLVDIMNSSPFELNRPPAADAGGPYVADEGSAVPFDGSGSSDPDGDVLQYRWDFDNDGTWDTPWSSDPTASYTWGDNRTGTVRLEVTDGAFSADSTGDVTIANVAPAGSIDSVAQPSPGGILPNQVLMFTGSLSDAGWLDTHTCTWAFGDGASMPGTVTEENAPPDATGSCAAQHAFSSPGIYNVTLSVADDDLASAVSVAWTITVMTPADMVQPLNEYIQGLPDGAFDKQPANRRSWFDRRLDLAAEAILAGHYPAAIAELQGVRSKADGSVDGNDHDDWIIDSEAQQEICAMIDALIAYLQSL